MSSDLPAREQAGAAITNACANCYENQIAARHAGAMHVLVQAVQAQVSPSLVECSVCALRNLCINCVENQEELSRCNGIMPLLQLLHSCTRRELLEVVVATLVKVCHADLSSYDPAGSPPPPPPPPAPAFAESLCFASPPPLRLGTHVSFGDATALPAWPGSWLPHTRLPRADSYFVLAGVFLVSSESAGDPNAVRRAQLARDPRRRKYDG